LERIQPVKVKNTKRQATQQSHEQINVPLRSKHIINKYLNEENTGKGKFSHPKRERKGHTHEKRVSFKKQQSKQGLYLS